MTPMFASREDAGQRLGRYLEEQSILAELVLGLPRGGVVVAAEVARVLRLPIDVLLVRKIGHPFHREYAVGALAERGVIVLDEQSVGPRPILRTEMDEIIEEERERLRSYQARFHPDGPPDLAAKTILLVDDGLATGATMQAAVLSARKRGARRIFVAAPVASTSAIERLAQLADEVRVLWPDPSFDAVGRYYDAFPQTTDLEVLALLRPAPGSQI